MIESIISMELPAGGHLAIRRNRICPEQETKQCRRISLVSGIHGDELEGQYVCYELNRVLKEQKEHVKGIVDIYPAMNPLGVDSITRGVPGFDIDMNRIFPGSDEGAVTEHMAGQIMGDIAGADFCVDIHASNIFLREILQVRMSEGTAERLLPYAKLLNTDFIWVHGAATVLESTLAYGLNAGGVPTVVVEMGVGMRITRSYGLRLTEGILCLMKQLGIWDGRTIVPKEPLTSDHRTIGLVHANTPGIFIPSAEHQGTVRAGERIGEILNPLDGTVLETVTSPVSGMVFTLREYPVVSGGSLIARVLGGEEE